MLAQYYRQTYSSERYDIGAAVQVHKFSETNSIPWELEGRKRLVAHATLHDIIVELPSGERISVDEGSMYAT
jgi:hypothetical protein